MIYFIVSCFHEIKCQPQCTNNILNDYSFKLNNSPGHASGFQFPPLHLGEGWGEVK